MSLEIAWKQNILVTDSCLLKLLLVAFGFGSQAFICGFSRQNICSVAEAREGKTDPTPMMNNVMVTHMTVVAHSNSIWAQTQAARKQS